LAPMCITPLGLKLKVLMRVFNGISIGYHLAGFIV
jgi:hypothetical protein